MISSKCVVKVKFIKEQEARGLLSNLGKRTPLSQIPLLGPILFQNIKYLLLINKSLLAWDKYMPGMHLRQLRFTYSACGLFTKKEKESKNLNKQEIHDIFFKTN